MKLGVWAYVIYAFILIVVIALFIVVWKYGDKLEYKLIAFLNRILLDRIKKVVVFDKAIDVFNNSEINNDAVHKVNNLNITLMP